MPPIKEASGVKLVTGLDPSRFSLRGFAEHPVQQGDEVGYPAVCESVEHVLRLFAAPDQARLAQFGDLLRQGRLANTERVFQVADRALAVDERRFIQQRLAQEQVTIEKPGALGMRVPAASRRQSPRASTSAVIAAHSLLGRKGGQSLSD